MEISFDPAGIILSQDERTVRIPWDTVESVFAYKQDLVIVDRVATLIKMDGDMEIEVHEEMPGWKELVDVMPEHLPNCRDFADWYMDVAFPAFEVNLTLIYKRQRPGEIH